MTLLSAAFREQVKKTKDISMINEQQHSVAYSTGFLNIDFLNGTILNINDKKYFEVGIVDGSINAVIARSGAGKSTICTQWAANIIRPFKSSCVFMDNAESGFLLNRAMQLSGFSQEEFKKRFILRDAGINTESIYERIRLIHDIKVDHPEEYTYDTGIKDEYGKPIIKFEPTVYILDSLKAIMPKKLAEDEGSNMNGAITAKTNSDVFLRLVPLCREANIIMLIINHITQNGIGSFMPVKADLAYLKQNESLPGGKTTSTYLQNNIFRLDEKTKLKESETFGIDGAIVNVDIVKSRTNKAGKSATLVFDQNNGYDPDLSLFMYLKENSLLEGAGAYLRLPGSDIKFSQKQFKQTLYSNPEFYNQFVTVCYQALTNDILEREAKKKTEEQFGIGMVSPYQAILQQLNNQNA